MEQLITKSLIKRGWLRATIGLVFIKGVLGNIIMKTKLTIKLIIICALSYIGCNEQYEKNNINGLNGFILLTHPGTDPRRPDKFYKKLDELITILQNRNYRFTLLDQY